MSCVGSDIQNTYFKRDSGEVKGCNHLCTVRLDGQNHVILDTTKESSEQPTSAFRLELARCDS